MKIPYCFILTLKDIKVKKSELKSLKISLNDQLNECLQESLKSMVILKEKYDYQNSYIISISNKLYNEKKIKINQPQKKR